MAKLVDAPDLGSGVSRRVGSSPIRRTNIKRGTFFMCPLFGFLCIYALCGSLDIIMFQSLILGDAMFWVVVLILRLTCLCVELFSIN